MEARGAVFRVEEPEDAPRVEVLIADDDARLRSLVASRARASMAGVGVLEAAEGSEAIRIGLQRRPQVALLDVDMPRLGGIEVAVTLGELEPRMRLALYTGAPDAHRERAQDHRLPLFDKLDLDRAIGWMVLQARAAAEQPLRMRLAQTIVLECAGCGYGVARERPPDRCPMCQGDHGWIHRPWRPFSRRFGLL
jgi:CheY-like chemotaxis protein